MNKKIEYMRQYTHKNKTKINKQRRDRAKIEDKDKREKRLKRMLLWRINNREHCRESSRLQYQKDSTKFNTYKKEAKKRNYMFELEYELFLKLFHSNCTYCNKEDSRGIDRVDNSIGYIKENSVSCCEKCNRMKWKWSKQEFINHISKIYHIANA